MLSIFRKGAISKIMLGILAIGLFAIVITGFGTGGAGGLGGAAAGPEVLATVDGEPVAATELNEQVNRQLAAARAQQPELDLAAFLRGGAFEGILSELISAKALTLFGLDHGLVASKRMVDGEIASIPAFRNLAGEFDQNVFRNALAQQNITEAALRDEIQATMIRRLLLLPVAGSPVVPETMARQYAGLLLEARRGSVGFVPTEAMGAGTPPTDAQVNAFFKENVDRYTIPERRVLRIAAIGPDQLGAAAQVTDADIQAYYNANQGRYGASQTRTVSRVVLPAEAAARQFAQRIASGAPFEAAAQAAGFSAGDTALGAQTREGLAELTSPQVAGAAFGAAEGATVGPIQTPLGWVIARVDAVNQVAARPLASVRAEIEQALGVTKRQEALAALVTRVEDRIAEGEAFADIARAEGLAIQETPPLTSEGRAAAPGSQVPEETGPLLRTAFELSPDDDPVVETVVPDQRYAMLAVGRVIPAAPPPLAEIRDQVRADLSARRASDRARAVASAIVAKINAGAAPTAAFSEAGQPLPAPETIDARRLDIAQQGQQVPPPLAMLFSLPRGKARMVAAPNGQGWFVVHLAEVTPGDIANAPGLVEATRSQFRGILGEEYASQFVRAVEATQEIERNADAITATRRSIAQGAGSID